ncbi:hypothetical protein D9M70_613790 [compost metagenome]
MSSRAAAGAEEVWIGRSVAGSSSLAAGAQPESRVARLTNQARRRSGAPAMIQFIATRRERVEHWRARTRHPRRKAPRNKYGATDGKSAGSGFAPA